VIRYRVRLASESAVVLFVNVISLMPGTLSTRLEGGIVRVHALDRGLPIARQLARLEQRIAAIYGQRLQGGAP
jgi:multicomponent Na+:H+ antiporter subunit E